MVEEITETVAVRVDSASEWVYFQDGEVILYDLEEDDGRAPADALLESAHMVENFDTVESVVVGGIEVRNAFGGLSLHAASEDSNYYQLTDLEELERAAQKAHELGV